MGSPENKSKNQTITISWLIDPPSFHNGFWRDQKILNHNSSFKNQNGETIHCYDTKYILFHHGRSVAECCPTIASDYGPTLIQVSPFPDISDQDKEVLTAALKKWHALKT